MNLEKYPKYTWGFYPKKEFTENILIAYFLFWIFADIFFAVLSLPLLYIIIYISFSTFLKVLAFLIYGFYNKKIEDNPEKTFLLLCIISITIYLFLFYYAKFLISFFLPIFFLPLTSSLSFIFLSQILFLYSGCILSSKKQEIEKSSKIQKTFLYIILFLPILTICFAFVQENANLDSVAFFFIALNLLFLNLLYHLFYKNDTYNLVA
jgi:hypothetical protein